jgi:hypothetical protein
MQLAFPRECFGAPSSDVCGPLHLPWARFPARDCFWIRPCCPDGAMLIEQPPAPPNRLERPPAAIRGFRKYPFRIRNWESDAAWAFAHAYPRVDSFFASSTEEPRDGLVGPLILRGGGRVGVVASKLPSPRRRRREADPADRRGAEHRPFSEATGLLNGGAFKRFWRYPVEVEIDLIYPDDRESA